MKPLLAQPYSPEKVHFPCYVQPKLNGIRALYQGGRFQSRDELPWNVNLLAHLSDALSNIPKDVVLDGELYLHGTPLQKINGAVTPVRTEPNELTREIQYWVFDMATATPTKERIPVLRDLLEDIKPPVYLVPTVFVANSTIADFYYEQFKRDGYEGIIYRHIDGIYSTPKQIGAHGKPMSDKNNRTRFLIKRKNWLDDDFECVDVQEGEGKLTGALGAVVCRTADGKDFKVGVFSGFTQAGLRHLWENPPIGRRVKVKYLVLSEQGLPLNATVTAIEIQ